MKNTFFLSIGLLLLFTLGGSYAGYRIATTEHHEEKPAAAAQATTPEASTAAPATDKTEGEAAPAATTAAAPAGDAAAGKEKFAGTCAGCHGANAEGGMGPALKVAKDWTPEQFHAAVREGKAPDKTLGAAMPHFTTEMLSDTDLANIQAFVHTLN